MRLLLLYSVVVFAVIISCTDNVGEREKTVVTSPNDTLYSEKAILQTYGYNARKAFALVDSARLLGYISDYRAQFYRTLIYSGSVVENHKDSALIIGEALMQHDSVKNNDIEQYNILDMLIKASRLSYKDGVLLRWATAMVDLCNKMGDETELLRTKAEIAQAYHRLGWHEEGLAMLDEIIRSLDGTYSLAKMDALIITLKRKLNYFRGQHRYAEVLPLAKRILEVLDNLEKHPQDYVEDSFRLPNDPEDRKHYIDFYRSQAYAFIAEAYAIEGERSKAYEYLQYLENSDFGQSFGAKIILSTIYQEFEQYDRAETLYQEIKQQMGVDTLTLEYAMILKNEAVIAGSKGLIAESRDLWQRYALLNNMLNDRVLLSKAHGYAALYHARDQQLEIVRQKTSSIRNAIWAVSLAFVALLAVFFSIYYYNKQRDISRKYLALGRKIDRQLDAIAAQQQAATVTGQEPAAVSAVDVDKDTADDERLRDLFNRINRDIRDNHLYANVNFQRQDILTTYNISRNTLNSIMNTYANGMAFPAFVNSIRIERACLLLRNNLDKSAADIADEVGLTQNNFYRIFKQHFGQTPLQYRQAHRKISGSDDG